MLQNFLAGFGGVGGACALITLGLKVWPGFLSIQAQDFIEDSGLTAVTWAAGIPEHSSSGLH